MGYDIVSLVPAFCDALTGRGNVEGGLPFPEQLKQSALDFSLESLHLVDQYLNFLHARADEIENQQYINVVLAAGCYVGEVMRRLTRDKYKWVNYANYFLDRPKLAQMVPEGVGTAAVLASVDGESMRMPLNKIARFIAERQENYTHYFVAAR